MPDATTPTSAARSASVGMAVEQRQRQRLEPEAVACAASKRVARRRAWRAARGSARRRAPRGARAAVSSTSVAVHARAPTARLPGSSANTGCATPSFSCVARLAPRRERRRVLRQRMADEGDRDAGRLVERRLERKQREHPVDARGRSSSARSRRHAQTDGLTKWIVRTPRALQLALEAEVEIRRVDADEQRHALGEQPAPRAARRIASELAAGAPAPRRSRAPTSFSSGYQASQPAASIRGPAMPTKRACGMPRAHGADQRRRERVARRLAGDDADRDRRRRAAASRIVGARRRSADDAAAGRGEELDERRAAPARRPRRGRERRPRASSSVRPSR